MMTLRGVEAEARKKNNSSIIVGASNNSYIFNNDDDQDSFFIHVNSFSLLKYTFNVMTSLFFLLT